MLMPVHVKDHSTILISGCGGGFDFLCGSPIGLDLERLGCKVVYSSYSFSNVLGIRNGKKIGDRVIQVDENSTMDGDENYFPEKYFCEWYRETCGKSTKIYCYQSMSIRQLTDLFNQIYEGENIDYHFVVDGGCDGVFRGDEYDLGTPSTDAISIIAADLAKRISSKFYVMTAFGTEGVGKEVSHAQVLNRISEITASGKMVAVSSITNDPELSKQFLLAFEYISRAMPSRFRSTIAGSIAASLAGKFGDREVNQKTQINKVWVSPLTSLLWFLDLESVARNKLYYKEAVAAETSLGVHLAIERFIKTRQNQGRESIPI